LAALKQGKFVAVHLSNWGFLDKFAAFLDEFKFYDSFEAFGNLRERVSIPVFFFMMVMTYKTLLGYDSFNILPQTLFASVAILQLLGFNAKQIREGFYKKQGKTGHFRSRSVKRVLTKPSSAPALVSVYRSGYPFPATQVPEWLFPHGLHFHHGRERPV
jgi:hypothetical protein